MEQANRKTGKIFLAFAALCVIALPFVVYSALTHESEASTAEVIQSGAADFDHEGGKAFLDMRKTTQAFLEGSSGQRTLEEYYSLRQYPGSPPYISHDIVDRQGEEMTCLACHEKGGWSEELDAHTPVTPHPEQTACRQCHVRMKADNLFVQSNWMSVRPPKLGRSHLPGGPPPIVHDLQMRGNCIACHAGPAAVEAIRSEHAARGNCRQCHVPDAYTAPFETVVNLD